MISTTKKRYFIVLLIVALVCLVQRGALTVYFLIPTANGIEDMSKQDFLGCGMNWSLVAVLILVLPAQSRDFNVQY